MLGASSSVVGSGFTTYTFTPADLTGKSLSVQVGRPTTAQAMTAFSYSGVKVADWTIGVKSKSQATFMATLDGWLETTTQTYVAPSYVSSNVLTSPTAQLLIGGTASTASGITTVTGATSIAYAQSADVKVSNGLDVARFPLGSMTKLEQLPNAPRKITGSLVLDFANLTDFYAAYQSDTPMALQLTFTGPVITGSTHSSLSVLLPEVYFDQDSIPVDGPALLKQTVSFTALDDATNNPIQVTYVTLDSAL